MFVKLYDFCVGLVNNSVVLTNWLFTDIWEGFSPIMLISIGGLIAYLGVAIVKWAIN